ncbi:MAG: hypothetical protein GY765_06780 [bacterium]|nr:hypothetical protein [bacterium]
MSFFKELNHGDSWTRVRKNVTPCKSCRSWLFKDAPRRSDLRVYEADYKDSQTGVTVKPVFIVTGSP